MRCARLFFLLSLQHAKLHSTTPHAEYGNLVNNQYVRQSASVCYLLFAIVAIFFVIVLVSSTHLLTLLGLDPIIYIGASFPWVPAPQTIYTRSSVCQINICNTWSR